MPNSSYDVDEILKEVRKRRIENEEIVKANKSDWRSGRSGFYRGGKGARS